MYPAGNFNGGIRGPMPRVQDVARFRQAVVNAAVRNQGFRRPGPPVPPSVVIDPEWREWKRIEAALKKHRFGRIGMPGSIVPSTFDEYKQHKDAFEDILDDEEEARSTSQASWDHENKQTGREQWVPAKMAHASCEGLSTVLKLPTIWTAIHMPLNPHRDVSVWPAPEEFREEGDERHTSQFGRFMPLPRAPTNDTVSYKYRNYMVQEQLDEINPVPFSRGFHFGLYFDANGKPYDDHRQYGREAVVEKSMFINHVWRAPSPFAPMPTDNNMAMIVRKQTPVDATREELLVKMTANGNNIIPRARRGGRRRRENATNELVGESGSSSQSTSGTSTPHLGNGAQYGNQHLSSGSSTPRLGNGIYHGNQYSVPSNNGLTAHSSVPGYGNISSFNPAPVLPSINAGQSSMPQSQNMYSQPFSMNNPGHQAQCTGFNQSRRNGFNAQHGAVNMSGPAASSLVPAFNNTARKRVASAPDLRPILAPAPRKSAKMSTQGRGTVLNPATSHFVPSNMQRGLSSIQEQVEPGPSTRVQHISHDALWNDVHNANANASGFLSMDFAAIHDQKKTNRNDELDTASLPQSVALCYDSVMAD